MKLLSFDGDTVLHLAVEGKNPEVVDLLLSRGVVQVDAPSQNEMRRGAALRLAAANGYTEIIRLLLSKGAKVNGAVDGARLPLSEAARFGHLEATKLLLDSGADFRAVKDEWTALFEASLHGCPEVVRVLVEAGADVSPPTVLYHLAGHGLEGVSMLVVGKKGVDVNGRTARMSGTALHQAAKTGLGGLVRVLLYRGADVRARDSDGRTPRDLALRSGHKDVIDLLSPGAGSWKEKEKGDAEPEDDLPPPYTG